ncbi:MAG: hypothetical protein V3V85_00500, partial [Candidatus Thorarchaeota archaeon]
MKNLLFKAGERVYQRGSQTISVREEHVLARFLLDQTNVNRFDYANRDWDGACQRAMRDIPYLICTALNTRNASVKTLARLL